MNNKVTKVEGIYEYTLVSNYVQKQLCPVCKKEIGIIPGSKDAICNNCGYKDPCCE